MVAPPSVAVLLPGTGSVWSALTVALLVGVPGEATVVAMVMVPSETLLPGPAPVARSQVTVWPRVEQVQPLPEDGVTEVIE